MDTASGDNRFAPPLANVEDRQDTGRLAGRGTRLGAVIIDGLLSLLAFGALALVSPINVFRPDIAAAGGFWMELIKSQVAGLIFFVAIHGYLIATRSQTVGKALLKIRIVRLDGSPASFGRIVGLRYVVPMLLAWVPVVGWIFGLLDALFIFRASRRCLHDLIADTVVVTA
jgi:uncharacterized RDD family membrane protein YckC